MVGGTCIFEHEQALFAQLVAAHRDALERRPAFAVVQLAGHLNDVRVHVQQVEVARLAAPHECRDRPEQEVDAPRRRRPLHDDLEVLLLSGSKTGR